MPIFDSTPMGSHGIEGSLLRVRSGAARDSIIEHVRAAMAERGPELRDLLIDARQLVDAPEQLSTELIHQRAVEIARSGFRRCAVVPANVPLQRALATYFALSAKSAGLECRVFLVEEEAETWLAGRPTER
jgi:hypothetical protein